MKGFENIHSCGNSKWSEPTAVRDVNEEQTAIHIGLPAYPESWYGSINRKNNAGGRGAEATSRGSF